MNECKQKTTDNLYNELIDKIDRTIDEKAIKTGQMASENVFVAILLTDEEKEIFFNIEKYNCSHYGWEFNGNYLYISYTEDIPEELY